MQPILSDYVFSVVPLTLTTYRVLQSFPISHLCEIPVSTPPFEHTGEEGTLFPNSSLLKAQCLKECKSYGGTGESQAMNTNTL